MRLPHVKIPSLNSKKTKKRDKGSSDEHTSSTISTNSLKEAPISPTKTDKAVTVVDTDTTGKEMEAADKGDNMKVNINPYEFFESDTWQRNPGQSELQLVINEKAEPPQKPRDWLADVKISTDSGIAGISGEPTVSSTKTYYSILSSHPTSTLTRSMSLDDYENSVSADNIIAKQPQRRHTSGNLIKNASESAEDRPKTADPEARQRRRRTYHVTHLQANPFFHATFKKSKIQEQT